MEDFADEPQHLVAELVAMAVVSVGLYLVLPDPFTNATLPLFAALSAAFLLPKGRSRRTYFEIERLNMRSIFSLVASQQAWLAWAAASA